MAAGLLENDWMLSTGKRPWHGIGTVVATAPTSDEALRIAKLDWDVLQYPVYANNLLVPEYFANVRSDTQEALGVVKGRYRIQQNKESFSFVDGIVSNGDVPCRYETAGSLFNGRKVFLLVKLPEQTLVGDKVENYLFFTNSHDGTSSFMAGITNVRVVCNNTLQLATQTAQRVWRCRHTESLDDKKKEAQESLGLAVAYMESLSDVAEKMAAKKVSEETFIRNLLHANPQRVSEKALQETCSRIHEIYKGKDDLQNFKGSAWGLYNAVADFCSNTRPQRETKTFEQNRLLQSLDGFSLLATTQKILLAA